MLTIEDMGNKIEAKKEQIAKTEGTLSKHQAKLEKLQKKLEATTDTHERYWVECDISHSKEDIKNNERKLRDQQRQLNELEAKAVLVKKDAEYEIIPALEAFLESWKQKVIAWHIEERDEYYKLQEAFDERRKDFEQWCIDNFGSKYGLPRGEELRKQIEAKKVEMKIDRVSENRVHNFGSAVLKRIIMFGRKWNEELERLVEDDKNIKRKMFFERVRGIVGEITDVSYLRVGSNGELNGIVIGTVSKAKIETITAGGYNIQCFHFRVLVHELKK